MKTPRNKVICCLFIMAVLCLTGSAGCIFFESSANQSKIPPVETNREVQTGISDGIISEMYSYPLGAFRDSWAVLTPNTIYETDYVFYSNAWGPGEVNYTLSGPIISEKAYENWSVSIQPSTFTAKPNTEYISHVTVKTGSQPFGYGLVLYLNATLSDNSTHLSDDTLVLYPGMPPGLYSVGQDSVSFNRTSIRQKNGETRNITIEYQRGTWAGFGDIVYALSPNPLNVTIIPSTVHVKHGLKTPSVLCLHIPQSTPVGNYTFNLSVHGASPWLYIYDDSGTLHSLPLDQIQKKIPFEVSVE